jgi:hypothetical protein
MCQKDMCQAREGFLGLVSGFGSGQATCVKQRELLVAHSSWHIEAHRTSRAKRLNVSVARVNRLNAYAVLSSTPLPF